MKRSLALFCSIALCGPTLAASGSCIEAPLSNTRTPEIVVAQRQAAHLEFPEAILRPVLGDAQRWQIAAYAETPTHLWITPTELVTENASTTLTVLTTTGAFDFLIKRAAEEIAPTCYRFYFEQSIGTMSLSPAIASPVTSAAPVSAGPLPAPGRYAWKSKDIVDVRDDGRFTYVRFDAAPRRLPAITDELGGPVDAQWQPEQLAFRIVGLFDGLRVHVGRRPIQIKRQS